MKTLLKLTETYTTLEKQFLLFLNDEGSFPLKGNSFKFLLVSTSSNETTIRNFFDGLLDDMLLFKYNDYYLFIFQNKERLELQNFIALFNEDLGEKSYVFEGFSIRKEKKEYLNRVLEIINDKYTLTKMYSSPADLVLSLNGNKDLKEIILDKYLLDNEFIHLIDALFKNNLNISKTASDIYMHRNTVNNKLNNFERDTNIQIQNFKDAVAVYELLK